MIHTGISQDFSWEQINSVPEGYQYVMGSNDNGEMVAAGVEFSDDYPMQIHYCNSEGVWIQIPGNGLAASMVGSIHITDNQDIYACDFAMGLFRTSDLGQNWTGVGELVENGCSAFQIHENGSLFIFCQLSPKSVDRYTPLIVPRKILPWLSKSICSTG